MLRGLMQEALESRGFTVRAVGSAREALREFDAIDPDVFVADIELGSVPDGVQLAKLLLAQAPYLGIVFVTNHPTVGDTESARTGLPRFSVVHKAAIEGPDALAEAIESALDDSIEPARMVRRDSEDPVTRLSASQLGVLRLIAEGWSNAQIAEQRGISVRATERLVARVFTALGISGDGDINARVTATRLYIRAFGVPEPPARRPR